MPVLFLADTCLTDQICLQAKLNNMLLQINKHQDYLIKYLCDKGLKLHHVRKTV